MDDELRRLRHELSANPHDEAAARRYQSALERAGHSWVIERFLIRKYVCRVDWNDMNRGAPEVRSSCHECGREVELVTSAGEATARLGEGSCVAVPEWHLRGCVKRMASDSAFHIARSEDAPCLVPHRFHVLDEEVDSLVRVIVGQARSLRCSEVRVILGLGEVRLAVRGEGDWTELRPPPPPATGRRLLERFEALGHEVERSKGGEQGTVRLREGV